MGWYLLGSVLLRLHGRPQHFRHGVCPHCLLACKSSVLRLASAPHLRARAVPQAVPRQHHGHRRRRAERHRLGAVAEAVGAVQHPCSE